MASLRSFLAISAALVPAMLLAQEPPPKVHEIDLGLQPPGSTASRPVRAGEHAFRLTNTLFEKNYIVTVVREEVPIPALVSPFAGSRGGPPMACKARADFENNIKGATSEAALREARALFWATADLAGCDRNELEREERGLTSRLVDDSYEILAGEQLEVIVERQDDSSQRWTTVFTTGPAGEWRTLYGFTFVPDRDDRYSAKATDTAGVFTVARDKDRRDGTFLPSILFQWARGGRRANWQNGLVAGLGFEETHPAILAGWGWTYRENITLTLGVAIHEQKRLAGKYHEDDPLAENLAADQLVETTFAPNAYVGVAFRFSTNIHEERAKAAKAQAEAAAAAASANQKALAAEKQAAEAEATLRTACKSAVETKRVEEVAKCTQPDAAVRASCTASAEAHSAEALVGCATAALDRAEARRGADNARRAAEAAHAAMEAKKKACLDKAAHEQEAALADCASTAGTDSRKKCEAKARADGDAAILKCLTDFGG